MKEQSVLFILNNLEGGGAERIFVNIANEFVSRRIKVELLLGKNTGVYFDIVDPRIKISVIDDTSFGGLVKKLLLFFKKGHYTHIFTASDYISAAAMIAKRRLDAKFILIATLHYNLPYQLSILPFANRLWLKWLNRTIISRADKIVAVSNGVNEGFRQIVRRTLPQLTTIYNPVFDTSIYTLASENIEDIYQGKSFLINIGRLTIQKNQHNLLQAFKIISNLRPDLELLLLGIGDKETELKAFIKANGLENRVRFLGFQPNPFKYLSKAKLFVLSSDYEGLPTVIIESLALGTNVVSTDCPSGPREILDDEKFGFLAKVKDPVDLARKIEEALLNPKPLSLLKERSEIFLKDKIIAKYLDIIN